MVGSPFGGNWFLELRRQMLALHLSPDKNILFPGCFLYSSARKSSAHN
jgi:hypothetical protein